MASIGAMPARKNNREGIPADLMRWYILGFLAIVLIGGAATYLGLTTRWEEERRAAEPVIIEEKSKLDDGK